MWCFTVFYGIFFYETVSDQWNVCLFASLPPTSRCVLALDCLTHSGRGSLEKKNSFIGEYFRTTYTQQFPVYCGLNS